MKYFFSSLVVISLFLACHQKDQPVAVPRSGTDNDGVPPQLYARWMMDDGTFDVNAYHDALTQARYAMFSPQSRVRQLNWQEEGPGNIGGRVNCIVICPGDSSTMLAGTPGGGIFKTTDGGINWRPVFDNETSLNIGCITYDALHPDTVYAGTGDPNVTGFTYTGDGIYRSVDGGETWTQLGLQQTRIISKIIIDPANSNTIYVAALGQPFVHDGWRGVYKTTDGGISWIRVLHVSDQAGVVDMVMDETDPQTIYAASFDRMQSDTEQIFSGNDSKIWRTTDGGTTWNALQNDLPAGKHSRIGLAVTPADPTLVCAVITDSVCNVSGVFLSHDHGTTWTGNPISNNTMASNLNGFFWYFGRIFIHPQSASKFYLPGVSLWYSSNDAVSWSAITPATTVVSLPHQDIHDVAFGPGGKIFTATDGGIFSTVNNGTTWVRAGNFPITQYYHVAINPWQPGNYYGGAQDNCISSGNSSAFNNWTRYSVYDGFGVAFNPADSLKWYFMAQGGWLFRTLDGGNTFNQPYQGFGNRCNWDTPFCIDKDDPDFIYVGANRVGKMNATNVQVTYSSISPDLTMGDQYPGQYGYVRNVISALCQSSADHALLYAGTSDGRLWRGDNHGTSWADISGNLPVRYVTSVQASPNEDSTVYVTYSGYRHNEYVPHIFRSSDRGNSWTDISGDLPPLGVNDIEVIPGSENILFAATDGGVYVTENGGLNWSRAGTGMPLLPVFDVLYDTLSHRLVAGTFGRSMMTISVDSLIGPDDIVVDSPLSVLPTITDQSVTVSGSSQGPLHVQIVDVEGKKVAEYNGEQVPFTIDVSLYADGCYILVAEAGEERVVQRFVKYR